MLIYITYIYIFNIIGSPCKQVLRGLPGNLKENRPWLLGKLWNFRRLLYLGPPEMYPSKREKDWKSRRNYGVYLFTIAKRHFWEGLGIKRSTSRLQAVPIKSLCGASVWMQILEARSTGPEKTDDGEWSFFAMKSMGFVRKKKEFTGKNLWFHQTSGDFTCCANMYQSHRDLTYDFTGRDFIQWTRWEPPTTLVGWPNAISIGLAICVYTYRRFFWIFPDFQWVPGNRQTQKNT